MIKNRSLPVTACKRIPESFLSGHRLNANRNCHTLVFYTNSAAGKSRTKKLKLQKNELQRNRGFLERIIYHPQKE